MLGEEASVEWSSAVIGRYLDMLVPDSVVVGADIDEWGPAATDEY